MRAVCLPGNDSKFPALRLGVSNALGASEPGPDDAASAASARPLLVSRLELEPLALRARGCSKPMPREKEWPVRTSRITSRGGM